MLQVEPEKAAEDAEKIGERTVTTMNAVLISIQPKWCEKIANGQKTVEVRKNRPKLKTPFKCYIYCTANGITAAERDRNIFTDLRCKVIGEFTCDNIFELAPINRAPENLEDMAGLTREELVAYLKGKGYGWHISNIVIYDTPKELCEFFRPCIKKAYPYCFDCEHGLQDGEKPHLDGLRHFDIPCGNYLKRPPQSWCYVEVTDQA